MKLVTELVRPPSLAAATLALHLVWVPAIFAQEPAATETEALRVFLDCARCDDDYLRQQITYLCPPSAPMRQIAGIE